MLGIKENLKFLNNIHKFTPFAEKFLDFCQKNDKNDENQLFLDLLKNHSNQSKYAKILLNFLNDLNKKSPQKSPPQELSKEPKQAKNQQQPTPQKQQNQQPKNINLQTIEKLLKTDQNQLNPQPQEQIIQAANISQQFEISLIAKYKIFTKNFDQVILAKKLTNKDELKILNERLKDILKNLSPISKKAQNKLKQTILVKKNIKINRNKEEGVLNYQRLSNIITNPLSPNNYITKTANPFSNTNITILLDNSGSMRGAPINISIAACKIICEIFEKFNIKNEILGFTTTSWRGGKSRQAWEKQGKKPNPGRISDLRHIIYKSANMTLKKSLPNLALMLKEGILKENIDGEALLFALRRQNSSLEKNKILIIISDGMPIDDATNSNNPENYLNNHLKSVIAKIEKKSDTKLIAIGIGHDVGKFYSNAIKVENLQDLGDALIEKITKTLAQ